MGFDEATLQPTYILKLGVPGKSAGLDIATRLEMPADVLCTPAPYCRACRPIFNSCFRNFTNNSKTISASATELDETRPKWSAESRLEQDALRRERERQREWTQLSEKLVANFEERARDTIDRLTETVVSGKPRNRPSG